MLSTCLILQIFGRFSLGNLVFAFLACDAVEYRYVTSSRHVTMSWLEKLLVVFLVAAGCVEAWRCCCAIQRYLRVMDSLLVAHCPLISPLALVKCISDHDVECHGPMA